MPTEPSERAKEIGTLIVCFEIGADCWHSETTGERKTVERCSKCMAEIIWKHGVADLEARLEAAERKLDEDTEVLRKLLAKNDDLTTSLANHRCSGCGAGYHEHGIGPNCYETVADEYASDTKRERDEARADYNAVVTKFDDCRDALAFAYKHFTNEEPIPPDDYEGEWHDWLIEEFLHRLNSLERERNEAQERLKEIADYCRGSSDERAQHLYRLASEGEGDG